MKSKIIRRQRQRKRIAKAIKDLRSIKDSRNKKDALECLRLTAENYPKIGV